MSKKKTKLNIITIFLIIFFAIVFLAIILPEPKNQSESPEKISATLSIAKKEEICKDTLAYLEFCYVSGIDGGTCVEQIYEKTIRLYEITPKQWAEAWEYCTPQIKNFGK